MPRVLLVRNQVSGGGNQRAGHIYRARSLPKPCAWFVPGCGESIRYFNTFTFKLVGNFAEW